MRADLLLKLADLLEADAANPSGLKFSMGNWANGRTLDCKTTGCAMGLAALSGEFPGLRLEEYRMNNELVICYDAPFRLTGYAAAAALFDLSRFGAERLFAPSSYSDDELTGATAELAVAARIRKFVQESKATNDRG